MNTPTPRTENQEAELFFFFFFFFFPISFALDDASESSPSASSIAGARDGVLHSSSGESTRRTIPAAWLLARLLAKAANSRKAYLRKGFMSGSRIVVFAVLLAAFVRVVFAVALVFILFFLFLFFFLRKLLDSRGTISESGLHGCCLCRLQGGQ